MDNETRVIEFDSKVTDRDLFNFKMYHYYTSFSGIFMTLCGVIMLVISAFSIGRTTISYTLIIGLFGVMFTIYQPVSMFLNSRRQAKKENFMNPMHYAVTPDKLVLTQQLKGEKQTVDLDWNGIYKLKFTGKNLLIYFDSLHANILTLSTMDDKAEAFVTIACEQLKPFQIKVNKKKLAKLS